LHYIVMLGVVILRVVKLSVMGPIFISHFLPNETWIRTLRPSQDK
jgi:hypothetical protein